MSNYDIIELVINMKEKVKCLHEKDFCSVDVDHDQINIIRGIVIKTGKFEDLAKLLSCCISTNEIADRVVSQYHIENFDLVNKYSIDQWVQMCNELIYYLKDKSIIIDIKISQSPSILNSWTLKHALESEINKINESMENNNYDQVITSCKALVESTYKQVLDYYDVEYTKKYNMPQLLSATMKVLDISPSKFGEEKKELRNITSSVQVILKNVNDIRNEYSSGHGTLEPVNLPRHHVQLVVDSTVTMLNFVIGIVDFKQQK